MRAAVACWICPLASAQVITTYAGNDAPFTGAGQKATAVQIARPDGIAVDSQGIVFVAAGGLAMILKIDTSGVVSVVAGNGLVRYSGDGGPATGASLSNPMGLAVDGAGNLYIADVGNAVVRRVDLTGTITTVAGNGQHGFAGDGGPAVSAMLSNPTAVAVDKAGNLYIADSLEERIRLVRPDGTISTLAGNGTDGLTGDNGPALQAGFGRPSGLALDSAGNLYVADQFNNVVRKISNGAITTVAGNGNGGSSGDNGPATKAALGIVNGVAFDAAGNLYISTIGNQGIRRVDTSGTITTIAGTGKAGFSGDGSTALSAAFSTPGALAVDPSGAVLVVDQDNNRIRRVVPGGVVTTIAGQTLSIGDSGAATLARLTNPGGTAVDAAGNLYIADTGQNRIRKVTPSGTITTVAGTGATGGGGNGGAATAATLNSPYAVAVDKAGNLFIADAGSNAVRRVDAVTGVISAFAGTGACCYGGNGTGGDGGPATAATLYFPTSIAVDQSGNVYFTNVVQLAGGIDQGARVRRVTTDGKIDVYAGGGFGFAGDGGAATSALLGANLKIAVGPDGSLYIADQDNNRVRRVDPASGIITTVAGNGKSTPSGDGGQATSAGVSAWSVAVDQANNLYIGGLAAVRKVTPAGVIGTYAGNGQFSFSGDGGPATSASIPIAGYLSTDGAGNLYITDGSDERIRIVQPGNSALAVSPTSLAFTATGPASQTVTVTNSGSGTLGWATAVSTISGGAWLSVSPATGSSAAGQPGATVTVSVKPAGLANGDYYGLVQVTSSSASNPVSLVTVRLTVGTPGPDPPKVASGGVLNTASYSLQTPVAPGTLVAIFGSNLADAGQVYTASSFPWPTQLGGTSVSIGGELLPLYVVTPTQINAILPFDLPVGTTLPLVVTHGNALSAPEPVNLVASEPGVFTLSQNGSGTAIAVIVHADGSSALVGPGASAKAGDALVIYCTGLGAVSPRAVAGTPIPLQPLSTAIDPVTVTIGGVNAPVFFAGATAGLTGLYQVNVTVPSGIAASAQAPLILTQSGRSSLAGVTIPVQ